MLVLLLLCLCSSHAVQGEEETGIISIPADGNASMPCLNVTTLPVLVKVQLEENDTQLWIKLRVEGRFRELDTSRLSLTLSENVNGNHTCSVDNKTQEGQKEEKLKDVAFGSGENGTIHCNSSSNWTSLLWSHRSEPIATVTRGHLGINIQVVGNGSSAYIITSWNISRSLEGRKKTILMMCTRQKTPLSGFEQFMEEKYWIIVVSVLGYILFCVSASSCYIHIRRKRKQEKQRMANSRFFKMSSPRTSGMKSISQQPANGKAEDMTYQNVTLTKDDNSVHLSNKSSFVIESEDGSCYENANAEDEKDGSEGGDSYLEPMSPEEADDQIYDDGLCYENVNAEDEDGSEGSERSSLSYEDMNGPQLLQAYSEKSREEDVDSYENMQATLYAQSDPSLKSRSKSAEDVAKPSERNMVVSSPEQQ